MTGKIKPKNFQKRREQSQTFRDWHDEHKVFKSSINPEFGAVTERDKLYARKKNKGTLLDEEYIECENTHEVVEVLMGIKKK